MSDENPPPKPLTDADRAAMTLVRQVHMARWAETCLKEFLKAPDTFTMERVTLAMKGILSITEAARRLGR